MPRVALLTVLFLPVIATAEPRGQAPPPAPAEVARGLRLERVVRGLKRPIAVVFAPGDARRRMFLVEQGGVVKIWEAGKLLPRPFLDASELVERGGEEQGLLGMAFHPRFAENRRLFLNYTDRDGHTRIVERRASAADPDVAEPGETLLLRVEQPYANHNGGHLAFGPDDKLWIGLGDGGAGGDPHGNGQDDAALLGKMLRLDVDKPGARPEIVAKGLRNPWRYSFDRETGDLYIGDVGQHAWEEIHVLAAAKLGSRPNFGWNIAEGTGCYRKRTCKLDGLVAPLAEYPHGDGCSVTGGVVYRGKAIPALAGVYFYADYCTGLLRSFRFAGGEATDAWDWKPALDPRSKLARLSSFGEDQDGELYLVSLDGVVYKLLGSAVSP
jgi:glucose/arabinose dehydrogenase